MVIIGLSSNGRTADFESVYRGSNPCSPANTRAVSIIGQCNRLISDPMGVQVPHCLPISEYGETVDTVDSKSTAKAWGFKSLYSHQDI